MTYECELCHEMTARHYDNPTPDLCDKCYCEWELIGLMIKNSNEETNGGQADD